MNKNSIITLIIVCLLSCKNESKDLTLEYLARPIPIDTPLEFRESYIPEGKLVHRGIFSPDLEQYLYTISDKGFERFDVYTIKKRNGKWSEPTKAFFDSEYDEHGMSFSPDGNTIYFSSTRPTSTEGVSETWHIWKSDKVDGKWSEPTFVDVPNLRDKLVSHPTVTSSGTLYFHASELDYSQMGVYQAKRIDGRFQNAEKTKIPVSPQVGTCTPYVSPKEDYLIFAAIGDQLDLMICYNDGKGNWVKAKKLNHRINESGQGNPFVTPDNRFLFYTSGGNSEGKWQVNWVEIESELKSP